MTARVTWVPVEMRDGKAKNDLYYYILLKSTNIGISEELVTSKRLTQENVVLKPQIRINPAAETEYEYRENMTIMTLSTVSKNIRWCPVQLGGKYVHD